MTILAVIETLAIVFGAAALLVCGAAVLTIVGIYRKKRTIQRDGEPPLPNLPRNRAERRAAARSYRRSRA